MFRQPRYFIAPCQPRYFIVPLLLLFTALPAAAQQATQSCFTAEERERAEQKAKVWQEPDPDYDPVLGYNTKSGPRPGFPQVDAAGLAAPINCTANKKPEKGTGTTPKFHCSVAGVVDEDGDLVRYKVKPHFKGQTRDKRNGEIYGEFLSSRFSKALGFFADDEWVADVTCPDCAKSLTSGFQGASFTPFQPAAGIELPLGKGIDVKCDGKDSGALAGSLAKLLQNGAPRAEIDAFKLWLAFIDHGDTKTDNQKFSCLDSQKNADGTRTCKPGQAIFYVSDMGSTFGYAASSEKKAKLAAWRGKDPIKVSGGRCSTTAKSVGDASISEAGRQLLADGLQRLLDAEKADGLITKVFRASRNQERDEAPEAWAAEFERKARTIIEARCSN
ncbi:MAG: hypothetical protein QOF02_2433 [Blastocatellia bacterium]|jgi:hypothetical protein|nr:hypothetical protein [Blastocatellia bacterium]